MLDELLRDELLRDELPYPLEDSLDELPPDVLLLVLDPPLLPAVSPPPPPAPLSAPPVSPHAGPRTTSAREKRPYRLRITSAPYRRQIGRGGCFGVGRLWPADVSRKRGSPTEILWAVRSPELGAKAQKSSVRSSRAAREDLQTRRGTGETPHQTSSSAGRTSWLDWAGVVAPTGIDGCLDAPGSDLTSSRPASPRRSRSEGRRLRQHVRALAPALLGRREPQAKLIFEQVRERIDLDVHGTPQGNPHRRLVCLRLGTSAVVLWPKERSSPVNRTTTAFAQKNCACYACGRPQ